MRTLNKTKSKIAIVTGANTGLGFETSKKLAQMGYHVVMGCRSENKAQTAISRIRQSHPQVQIENIPLDLVNRDSIRQFAKTFKDRFTHLDLLINNAGVMGPEYTITQNNLELQFDANHMGHFLLTFLLMETLDQTYETRVINVSSLAGKWSSANIFFENLNFEGNYEEGPNFMGLKGMLAYAQSKLANIVFTMELKRRLEKSGKSITAVVVHPGASNTDLSRNFSPLLRSLLPVLKYFVNVSDPSDGAKPTIFAATQDSVKPGDFIGPTGKEERTGAPGKVEHTPKSFDEILGQKLWQLSEQKLGIEFAL